MAKIAFVGSGEGAKGAWQAMVICRLASKGIVPNLWIGSSSGGANGILYSLLGAPRMADWWHKIKSIRDLFSFNPFFLFQSGVFTTKPLKKKVDDLKHLNFNFPVYVPLTNAETGETNFSCFQRDDMRSETTRQMIVDAVTIPGVVRSDSGYVDGGSMILCPLKKAIDLGADEIYVILGRDPLVPKADFKPSMFLKFVAYGNRFLELLMFTVIKNDIANCIRINQEVRKMNAPDKREIKIHVLYPNVPLFDSLQFKKCRTMLDMGPETISEITDVALRVDL